MLTLSRIKNYIGNRHLRFLTKGCLDLFSCRQLSVNPFIGAGSLRGRLDTCVESESVGMARFDLFGLLNEDNYCCEIDSGNLRY